MIQVDCGAMRLGCLVLVGLLAACDRRPEAALCSEADRCEHTSVLVSTQVCADQVERALSSEVTDCRQCVTGLRCEAMEQILSGKQRLRDLCTTCTEHVEIPVVEGAPPILVAPAITYHPPAEVTLTVEPDELNTRAASVCSQGETCDGLMLLVSQDECVLQVSGALAARDLGCRRCASALSCAGTVSVVQGKQRLSSLCPACGESIDARDTAAVPGPGGPYMIIPGLVAVGPAPVEGEPVAAAPAAQAPEARPPASAPSAPANTETTPASTPSAQDRLTAHADVPPIPSVPKIRAVPNLTASAAPVQ